MYIHSVISSYVLVCLAVSVKSWHMQSNNRPQGEFKQQGSPPGVFHVGQIPRQNVGRVHVFTNPPTAPPPRTTPVSQPPQPLHPQQPMDPQQPIHPQQSIHPQQPIHSPLNMAKPATLPPLVVRPPIPTTTQPFDWQAYFATTYPSTKKGQCPSFDSVHASCYGRCRSDEDCFYERKCCRDGYGFGCCADPVQPGLFDNFFDFGPTTTSFFWKK